MTVGDRVRNAFKILSLNKRTKKNGDSFLALELMDKTGNIQGKIWEKVETYAPMIQAGEIYRINGSITEFMNKIEIKVESVEPVSEDDREINRADFEETPPFDVEKTFQEMMETLNSSITNPFLVQLIHHFSDRYGDPFKGHYGALKIHHAYAGGLLEHTLSVIKLAISVSDFYGLDKEIMVIGALFHDMGKLLEYTRTPTVEITGEGGLIGHIVLSNQIFLEIKKQIKDFPSDLSLKIQHLIVSHHGEREFGSPEVPKTPEAFALHIIDLLDSKLKIFQDTIQQTDVERLFSEYNRVLGRRIYNPKKEDE